MTDVLLEQTDDGGEITVTNGVTGMTPGLSVTVYLTLFGGNIDDPGLTDKTKAWWGNSTETEPVKQYRSRTQYLLRSLPVTSFNIERLAEAVEQDLAPLVSGGFLKEVVVTVTVPRRNAVNIKIESETEIFEYIEPWG